MAARRPEIPIRNRIRSVLGRVVRQKLARARNRFMRRAARDCRGIQEKALRDILRLNSDSEFSRRHGLSGKLSVSEFRSRLPVSDYELVREPIEQVARGNHGALLGHRNRLLMFAVTSGTTASAKLIPVTRPFVKRYRRGWQHWGVTIYNDHPDIRKLRMVQIISSHQQFRTAGGTPCGNISGLVTAMQKRIVRSLYTVPPAVARVSTPAARQYAVLRFAMADPFVGMFVTANPGTLLRLYETASAELDRLIDDVRTGNISSPELNDEDRRLLLPLLKKNPNRAAELQSIHRGSSVLIPSEVWPWLTALGIWSGGSAAAYLPRVRELYGDLPIRDHGLHASEGRMTIPYADNCSSGVLDAESHFFEFIPIEEAESADPTVLSAHELQVDREYLILLTTVSGLYRYNIQDVVRCTGSYGTTPELEFRQKAAHMSSITGEKICESQVVSAVREASAATGLDFSQFTLTPVWKQLPGYRLYLDLPPQSDASLLNRFAEEVDRALGSANVEYREKRDSGRLSPIAARHLDQDVWSRFRTNRLQKTGGSAEQYKHPFLMPDPRFEDLFLNLCELSGGAVSVGNKAEG